MRGQLPFRIYLRGARTAQGLTQKALAKRARVRAERISDIELGKTRPSAAEAERLFKALTKKKERPNAPSRQDKGPS